MLLAEQDSMDALQSMLQQMQTYWLCRLPSPLLLLQTLQSHQCTPTSACLPCTSPCEILICSDYARWSMAVWNLQGVTQLDWFASGFRIRIPLICHPTVSYISLGRNGRNTVSRPIQPDSVPVFCVPVFRWNNKIHKKNVLLDLLTKENVLFFIWFSQFKILKHVRYSSVLTLNLTLHIDLNQTICRTTEGRHGKSRRCTATGLARV